MFVSSTLGELAEERRAVSRAISALRLTPGGRVSVSGRLLIQTEHGTRTERRLDSDDELLAAYRDHFGIELSRLPDDPAA